MDGLSKLRYLCQEGLIKMETSKKMAYKEAFIMLKQSNRPQTLLNKCAVSILYMEKGRVLMDICATAFL